MIQFSHNRRVNEFEWIVCQINNLIKTSDADCNSSYVLYACLESRNLLELLEFTILKLSMMPEEFNNKILFIEKKNGLEKCNKRIRTLNLKYQLFNSVCLKVGYDLNSQSLKIKEVIDLKSQLARYIHSYYLSNEELKFESGFIQEGKNFCEKAIILYRESTIVSGDGKRKISCFNPDTLSNGLKKIFEDWKKSPNENTKILEAEVRDLWEREGSPGPKKIQ